MKKFLLLLLAMMLCLPFALAEETAIVYDFEDGAAGPFQQSGSCSLSVSDAAAHGGSKSLAVTGRSGNNWDCADLAPANAGFGLGDTVTISAWVYVDSDAEGTFCIAKSAADYGWYGSATIPGKVWTQVHATFTLEDEVNIRFQNYGEQWNSVNFYLDDVSVTVQSPAEAVPVQTVTTAFDFENGLPDVFAQSGSAQPAASTRQAHSGASALYVTGRSGNNWDCVDLKSEAANIPLNAPVKISFFIYVDSDEEGAFRVARGGGDWGTLGKQATFPGKTWTEMTVEFTMEEMVNIRFQNASDNWNNAEFYIDDMTLEVGMPIAEEEVVNDAPPMDYRSDFSQGLDGWYPRSGNADAALTVTEEGGILMTGRTGTWNSPGRDFELIPGRTYNITVLVKQETGEALNFIVSLAKTRDEQESYENWGSATVPSGEWTMIQASAVCTKGDQFVLYVEGGTENAEFQIKDFIITEPVSNFGALDVSLKEFYADKFVMGTAVTAGEYLNTERMEFYLSQFGIFTCGNEMKPDFLLDMAETRKQQRRTKDQSTVVVNFDNVVPLLDWAVANNVKIHGHVLVWYQQTPTAFFHQDYATHKPLLSREEMLLRMENYISQVLTWTNENYPGVIVSWDVVNEAIADGSTKIRDCLWSQVVGEDYVNVAFQMARKYAGEGVKLYYNDYNTDDTAKQIGILRLIDSLIADGTIDGYGFQSHYSIDWPTLKRIEIAWNNLAARTLADGSPLLLRVSELDVGIPDTSEANLKKQADYYSALFDLYVKYADRIEAVHVWGTVDDLSWRADKFPLLFDAKTQPKPAFYAIVD